MALRRLARAPGTARACALEGAASDSLGPPARPGGGGRPPSPARLIAQAPPRGDRRGGGAAGVRGLEARALVSAPAMGGNEGGQSRPRALVLPDGDGARRRADGGTGTGGAHGRRLRGE